MKLQKSIGTIKISNPLTPSIKQVMNKKSLLKKGRERVQDIGNQGGQGKVPKLDDKLGVYNDNNVFDTTDKINLHPYGDITRTRTYFSEL